MAKVEGESEQTGKQKADYKLAIGINVEMEASLFVAISLLMVERMNEMKIENISLGIEVITNSYSHDNESIACALCCVLTSVN